MRIVYPLVLILLIISCKEKTKTSITAQEIVDRSILASGGELYRTSDITYKFRDFQYASEWNGGSRILKRIKLTDSIKVLDVKSTHGLKRFINDSLVPLKDSIANVYANSVNSVHYFAYLPFGLNDPAVNKELLGEVAINGKEYYKLKVTFDQKGGGDDYDDVYLYWFNKETFKPDYLAYEFHVDGGGIRFRAAYNERYIRGIRFVDYENFEASPEDATIYEVDSLYGRGQLKLLSKIELKDISVVASD
ncbi:deoxyribose-phosphate aldolase [Arenibacter sp. BSSL-BM3]|uniref:Deoxyribose-phosphate aldolase n=1 Tax=Arenibacter arenosicollis TaxID=2762274 RepID=A0ABR7QQM3_9FLAO|nr:DUF6503 family protein [Arenibacter arenosicollis]MBC8769480.1 deoxyribose-phosphate aldolase [Arenibacter arenosicollis]